MRRQGDERERVVSEVRRAVERHALLPESGRVIVAVSGGADSLCLLGVLDELCGPGKAWPQIELVVAHLDHGLRGNLAEADAAWVAELASQLGWRCRVGKVNLASPSPSDTNGVARDEWRGLEDAARRARYAFLRDAAREEQATRICVGHTADDQAETLVLHWLRGSGLTGLTGMRPIAHGIARPLLGLRRGATHAYCASRSWEPREDATNADERFVRNRIRHSLMPALKSFNPNLVPTLVRNAEVLAEDESFLETAAADALEEIAGSVTEDEVTLDTTRLAALAPAVRRRVLRQAAALLKGNAYNLDAGHIALMAALVAVNASGSAVELPGGLLATTTPDRLTVRRREPAAKRTRPHAEKSVSVALPIPGVVELPASGWRVRATLLDAEAGALPPGLEVWLRAGEPETTPAVENLEPAAGTAADVGRAQLRAYLDADAAGDTLSVRFWQPGDRFRPLGMTSERKVQDYFVDAKVPRGERRHIPLVWGASHLLWIAGHRLDDRVRLTPATRRVLALHLEPLNDEEPSATAAAASADDATRVSIPGSVDSASDEQLRDGEVGQPPGNI